MNDPIQQQLIAARKHQILDAAAIVFAEHGFHPTTIRDVARQAGIADGTIYNYFDNKTALLLGIFERMRSAIMAQNPPPAPDEVDLSTFLREALMHPLMALRQDNFALFRIVVSEMLVNEEMRSLFYEQILQPTLAGTELMLQAHAAEFALSTEDARLAVRAISGLILGLMLIRIMGDEPLTEEWDRLPDVLADLLLNGLQGNAS